MQSVLCRSLGVSSSPGQGLGDKDRCLNRLGQTIGLAGHVPHEPLSRIRFWDEGSLTFSPFLTCFHPPNDILKQFISVSCNPIKFLLIHNSHECRQYPPSK
jgi:hypothetical protein